LGEKMIRPTNRFGDTHNNSSLKQRFKSDLLHKGHPIIDHWKTFAHRAKGQRGPARLTQTFLVSFPYNGAVAEEEIERFVLYIRDQWELQGHFEPCIFRNQDAWLIIIADSEVILEDAVQYARDNMNKN